MTMNHLPELIAAYACMTPWARGLIRELAAGYAIDFPLQGVAGSLRVGIEPVPNNANEPVNRFPLVVVRKPIDG